MVVKVLLAQYVQNTFILVNAWDVDSVMCGEKFLKFSVREKFVRLLQTCNPHEEQNPAISFSFFFCCYFNEWM